MFRHKSELRTSRGRELREMDWHDRVVSDHGWDMAWSYGECPSCFKIIGSYSQMVWPSEMYGNCPACGKEVLVRFHPTSGSRPEGKTPPTTVGNDEWKWRISAEGRRIEHLTTFWEAVDRIAELGLQRVVLERVPTPEELKVRPPDSELEKTQVQRPRRRRRLLPGLSV